MNAKQGSAAALALAIFASLPALLEAQQPRFDVQLDVPQFVPKDAARDAAVWVQRVVDLDGVKPSSHWMGVVVRPVDPLLQKHLRIDGGLVVQHVTKDSPAAEAGVEADDILLRVNDTDVADYQGLMKFLTENKDREVSLTLLREGKQQIVKVKPTERPAGHAQYFELPEIGKWQFEGETPEEIRKWIEEMAKQSAAGRPWKIDGENPLKLQFFHPGVLLGEGAQLDYDVDMGDLPKGLQVTITKQGDEPAKIKVRRGDDQWEVTEKQLDKLPEDVRNHVKKFLGRGARLGIRVEAPKALQVKPLERQRPNRVIPRVQARAIRIDSPDARLEKKLDQINERLEKIEQALEKLLQDE